MNEQTGKPAIVTAPEWQQARDELLAAEKEATRLLDEIAARQASSPDDQVRQRVHVRLAGGAKTPKTRPRHFTSPVTSVTGHYRQLS